jgi:hypothetical protein
MKTKSEPNQVQGEGNYKAAKQYGDAVKEFVKSGKVEKSAKNAAPSTPMEEIEMRKAEQIGLSKSKGEDPSSPKRKA